MRRTAVETVIVGGGQAGLATSNHLKRRDLEHVVLERASQPGEAWRNGRWDSFTLVTPNWSFLLPGAEYDGDDPDGFMPRAEIVRRFERYVDDFDLPVRFGVDVTSVAPRTSGAGYVVETPGETYEAANVVMATGLFQRPKTLGLAADLPADIDQIHSGEHRNPGALRDGAVLVVGSAQSGCQIAQELYQSGRAVYLCVGAAPRVPRRYRGRDIFEWMKLAGLLDRTVADLASPRERFAPNGQVSGRDGGMNLNLHQFARDGVVLLGHLRGAEDGIIHLVPDLRKTLAKTDASEAAITKLVDHYIARAGVEAPEEALPVLRDGYEVAEIVDLDLSAAGITTVIWAMGYAFDFGIVRSPVFDPDGYPVSERGVTASKGLYFVGLPWIDKWKSGLLAGVGEHAGLIASHIAGHGADG